MNRILLCRNPVWLPKVGFWAGCGHCPVCRLRRRKEWTIRMQNHAETTNHQALFVTLTYDNDHLPPHHTLRKSDVQKFYKRLRKACKCKISYFTCGEYGPKTLRPHYHAIIFGLGIEWKEIIYKAWGKCKRHCYKCKLISSADKKAFGYVAGYVSKKLGKFYNQRFIDENIYRIPEFQLQSTGIGKWYAETQLKLNDDGLMNYGDKQIIPPRYYRKYYNIPADIYKELLQEIEAETDCIVFDTYPELNHKKSDKFYQCKHKIAVYHNDLLVSQSKEWRNKV